MAFRFLQDKMERSHRGLWSPMPDNLSHFFPSLSLPSGITCHFWEQPFLGTVAPLGWVPRILWYTLLRVESINLLLAWKFPADCTLSKGSGLCLTTHSIFSCCWWVRLIGRMWWRFAACMHGHKNEWMNEWMNMPKLWPCTSSQALCHLF